MRRGSSGATLNVLGDRVVKNDISDVPVDSVSRVVAQGLWLQHHSSPMLPRVYHVYARSYVMERLITPPFWALDHLLILRHMYTKLMGHIWCQRWVVDPNLDHIQIKYRDLCAKFDQTFIREDLDILFDKIDWDSLRRCLTHGDPTFDNVMFRDSENGGDLVIADPIPATTAVPDLMSVDLGKILQSALGWEEIRYGSRTFKFRAGAVNVMELAPNDNERRATAFWGAMHLLRTFPYTDDNIHHTLKERIRAAIRLGL